MKIKTHVLDVYAVCGQVAANTNGSMIVPVKERISSKTFNRRRSKRHVAHVPAYPEKTMVGCKRVGHEAGVPSLYRMKEMEDGSARPVVERCRPDLVLTKISFRAVARYRKASVNAYERLYEAEPFLPEFMNYAPAEAPKLPVVNMQPLHNSMAVSAAVPVQRSLSLLEEYLVRRKRPSTVSVKSVVAVRKPEVVKPVAVRKSARSSVAMQAFRGALLPPVLSAGM